MVTFLPEDNFSYLHSHFRDCSDNQKRLLHRKGFYRYTYFDYRGKFSEIFYHHWTVEKIPNSRDK